LQNFSCEQQWHTSEGTFSLTCNTIQYRRR